PRPRKTSPGGDQGPWSPLSQAQGSQAAVCTAGCAAIVGSGLARETATAVRRTTVGSSSATNSRCSVSPACFGTLKSLSIYASTSLWPARVGAGVVPVSELRRPDEVTNSPVFEKAVQNVPP